MSITIIHFNNRELGSCMGAHQNITITSAIKNPLSACERAHSHL